MAILVPQLNLGPFHMMIAALTMSKFDARCQSRAWDRLRAKHSIVRVFLGT